jgi:16S rRNA (adenine1518-N6/adenine1519-N6)-dimethyltransferase
VPQSNPLPIDDQALLGRIVAEAFSKRRKTLRNALKNVAVEDELLAAGIDPGKRPEEVSIAAWIALANRIATRVQA